MTQSCVYEGTVRHRRHSPARAFEYRLALVYVDLEELPTLLSGRLVSRRPGLLRFSRRDYLGDPCQPLDVAVRDAVQAQTGNRPTGPVRVLTQLRSFGHCFNPASFYYCFDQGGERLQAVVAEVTSTPWKERHAYVIAGDHSHPSIVRAELDKQLHVSPFMGMDHRYSISAATPGPTLALHIDSTRDGAWTFDATLSLRRRALTRRTAAWLSARYPFATVRVLTLIYAQALKLKLAGATIHPHPHAGGA